MVRRGSVTVTHTDDHDYGLSSYTICSEEQTLQSGMMLNHCILYREISFKTFHLKPFGFTKEIENKTAYIALSFSNQSRSSNSTTSSTPSAVSTSPLIESIIPFHQASSHIHSLITEKSDEFVWLHLVDKQCLSLLAKRYEMPPIAVNAFMDVIPRTTFNVFNDQSLLLTMTSFCRHDDGIICSLKVCCYIKNNVIIIQERRTHASVQEIHDRFASTPSSPSAQSHSPTNQHFEQISSIKSRSSHRQHHPTPTTPTSSGHRLSEAQQSLGVSLRSVLHSIRASHVTEAEHKEHEDGPNQYGPYSGRVYCDLKQKLSSILSFNQFKSRGISYILYEVIYTMLEMTTPVISFYSQRQLALHDSVYVREEPPTHSEGNMILDRVDFIEAGFQLMENLTERSTLCLVGNREKLVTIMPEEYVSDIISSYEHALDVITDMHSELSRITDNINGIITRRNEQISIVLSLVATVFLPLTFIAGVFGMNFSNDGLLVYMLETSHGENYFWGSCAFCLVMCFYIFISKGWMDMLGKVRRGGQSNVLSTDGTNIVSTLFTTIQWNKIWRKDPRISSEE